MRIRTFADFVDGRTTSRSRVERVLATIENARLQRCGVSLKQLTELVIESIPEALDVDLDSHITQRWLRAQPGLGPWSASIDLRTTAAMELRGTDGAFVDIRLDFAVKMEQLDAQVRISGDRTSLEAGNGRSWRANWTLTVRPANVAFADPVASGRCEVHLTPHCFPLLPSVLSATAREASL
jgi:hypothetical protein